MQLFLLQRMNFERHQRKITISFLLFISLYDCFKVFLWLVGWVRAKATSISLCKHNNCFKPFAQEETLFSRQRCSWNVTPRFFFKSCYCQKSSSHITARHPGSRAQRECVRGTIKEQRLHTSEMSSAQKLPCYQDVKLFLGRRLW